MANNSTTIQLSVILCLGDQSSQQRSLSLLVAKLRATLDRLRVSGEIIVLMYPWQSSRLNSCEIEKSIEGENWRVVTLPTLDGGFCYGAAIKQGLLEARGDYVVTIEANQARESGFLEQAWSAKDTADIIIGARYVPGGSSHLPLLRRTLSRSLNQGLGWLLTLPVRDLTSTFRLYSRAVVDTLRGSLQADGYDILQEIIVRAHCNGWRIREIPLQYYPRSMAQSNRTALKEAQAFLGSWKTIWRLRNNASSCDYDARAFNSRIWPQRYWQRRRFEIISNMMRDEGQWLDIACGSSQLIRSKPAMIGLDINLPKLRFLRSTNNRLVNGTMFGLPFHDEAFDGVICSEVIEHVPKDQVLLSEMRRVLKPGGTLVLGTPDYSSALWNAIERIYGVVMPASYAEEHISHYTRHELEQLLPQFGFKIRSVEAIVNSEIIFDACKMK